MTCCHVWGGGGGTVSICMPCRRPILIRLTHDHPWCLNPWSEHLFTLDKDGSLVGRRSELDATHWGCGNERKLWHADTKFWWVSASPSTFFIPFVFVVGFVVKLKPENVIRRVTWKERKRTVFSARGRRRTGWRWHKTAGSERKRERNHRQVSMRLMSEK